MNTFPSFLIEPVSLPIVKDLQNKLNQKTKPLGSLGRLESLALKIGKIQNTLTPKITSPYLAIFAADHGIALEGVSAYPQEVTYQMVFNFLNGGAAANVLSKLHGYEINIIDAGVNYDFSKDGLVNANLIDKKIAFGTKSFLKEEAMTEIELNRCIEYGAEISNSIHEKGCNLIAFGEMGIGNTSSSSLLTHLISKIPLENCIGSGTGLNQEGIQNKLTILRKSLVRFHKLFPDPSLEDILRNFGGFEIMMMAGAMLQAASLKMILLVDGFISTAAFLCAYTMYPTILDYAIFSHLSEEKGHIHQLSFLKASPILGLGLRLGEGTGAILALPILQSSLAILNEMASFESARVSKEIKATVDLEIKATVNLATK